MNSKVMQLWLDAPSSLQDIATSVSARCSQRAQEQIRSNQYSAEASQRELTILRQALDAVSKFPSGVADDNPEHIFALARTLEPVASQNEHERIQHHLVDLVYDHAPALYRFETSQGSMYRAFSDGSSTRLKSNGITNDRCRQQYYIDAGTAALLERAVNSQLANFSMPVVFEPATGLAPFAVARADITTTNAPVLADGRFTWPNNPWCSFSGHVGHPIVTLEKLQ